MRWWAIIGCLVLIGSSPFLHSSGFVEQYPRGTSPLARVSYSWLLGSAAEIADAWIRFWKKRRDSTRNKPGQPGQGR